VQLQLITQNYHALDLLRKMATRARGLPTSRGQPLLLELVGKVPEVQRPLGHYDDGHIASRVNTSVGKL
jgi:hypothetical protein